MMFNDATPQQIETAMQAAWQAFMQYRKRSLSERAFFMKTIARELEQYDDSLIRTAMQETNLPEDRLRQEKARTIFQLRSYAEACERGDWLEARIDTAIPDRQPPKPDIRKMLVPLGPVVVFGSSNFPFAYSTAGGDTACAFAAGCSVVVKAHPAHAQTSGLVAAIIFKAIEICGMPRGLFAHLHGASNKVGEALVKHPLTKAVGFTGSYAGGKQLFDWGNQREQPIPVFAEMGSVNPVYLLPEKLTDSAVEMAKMYAASITLGVGQFCTNPGIIIGMESEGLQEFISTLGSEIKKVAPAKMLHAGIAKAYADKRKAALAHQGVVVVAEADVADEQCGNATLVTTTAENFLDHPSLHQEVFGPFSLVVRCNNMEEMKKVAASMEGQLTSTMIATEEELRRHDDLLHLIQNRCGRLILNGVPTGVEVCLSMQHGGPFPATTDPRFTSVGADGIKRFARPLAYQNWSHELLPDELKNENPLNIYRTVNDVLTKAGI